MREFLSVFSSKKYVAERRRSSARRYATTWAMNDVFVLSSSCTHIIKGSAVESVTHERMALIASSTPERSKFGLEVVLYARSERQPTTASLTASSFASFVRMSEV